jgi:hypothetical protein
MGILVVVGKEHDFGSFDCEGQRIFWKIDYYDRASFGTGCDMGSDDPTDPAKTLRILTIMLASGLHRPAPSLLRFSICGRPPPCKVFLQCFDQIACAHMSGHCRSEIYNRRAAPRLRCSVYRQVAGQPTLCSL